MKGENRFLQRIESKIALGGLIGFLSGLVSIGGGIFLSPILHLTNWAEAKRISALGSVFILVNSISGLLGQFLGRGINLEFYFTIISSSFNRWAAGFTLGRDSP
jgi:uncharacterized membrane protein YfcA